MKTAAKIGALLFLGLLTAGVGYPLLHEGGHILAALCTGGAVAEVRLLPTASVLCRMPTSDSGMVAVGLGGLLFPCAVAAVMPHRRFLGWFVRYILLTVSLISLGYGVVSAACFQAGFPLPQEDVTQILHYVPTALPLLYGGIGLALVAVGCLWGCAKPLVRLAEFFHNPAANVQIK